MNREEDTQEHPEKKAFEIKHVRKNILEIKKKKDTPCTYNVAISRVRVTNVAMEKQ